jgi:hypothetical protein
MYDRHHRPSPRRRDGPPPRQSRVSMALEAAGGGLVIALIIAAVRGVLNW